MFLKKSNHESRERSKSESHNNNSGAPKAMSYDGKIVTKGSKPGKFETKELDGIEIISNHHRTTQKNSRYSQQYAKPPLAATSSSSTTTTTTNNREYNSPSLSSTTTSSSTTAYNTNVKSLSNTSISSNSNTTNSTTNGHSSGHHHSLSNGSNGSSGSSETTSPTNKSRMKRLSLTVSVSTQKYLEKMGKGPQTTADTDDIRDLKSNLRSMKRDLKNIQKQGKQTIFTMEKENTSIQFGEIIKILGDGSLKPMVVGRALRELGDQIITFEEGRKEEYMNGAGAMLEPLIQFYQEEMKKSRELKRKQNLTRIRYEQATTALHEARKKNDPYSSKTKQAKKDEEDTKAQYTQTTAEFIETMKVNKKKIQGDLRAMVKEYVEMQVEFYREAAENWEEFQEVIESILPDDGNDVDELHVPTHSSRKSKDDSDESDDSSSDDDISDL